MRHQEHDGRNAAHEADHDHGDHDDQRDYEHGPVHDRDQNHPSHTGHSHTGHSHSGHSHALHPDADRHWLLTALALIVGFMGVEVVVGVFAHSLALLSDAAHMLTDAASIGLALFAMRLAARPARGGYTFGLKRAEILSAQANGITLLVLSAVLGFEAVRRLADPPAVTGGLVLATALAGIVVNIAAAWSLSKANRSSLNVEGAFQHVLTDLYGFIATAIAGLLVLTAGFARADAIASLVVVALMVKAGAGLVTAASRIFLEAAPAGVDPDAVGDQMAAAENVVEVHDLHIWEITSGQAALSAHVLVVPGRDCHKVRRDLQEELRGRYGITHATLQVDHLGEDQHDDDSDLLQISARPPGRRSGHCEDAHGPVHTTGAHAH